MREEHGDIPPLYRGCCYNYSHNWFCCHQNNCFRKTSIAGENLLEKGDYQIDLILQLQLSEVIARARKYHQEVTGEKGTVIEAHVNKETFKQDLLEAGVEIEKPAVQNFLEHMTADQKGIINLFDWKSLLDVKMDTHLQVQNSQFRCK